MPAEVLAAMAAAAESFVDLNALQERVGERIAELTHNEAAYVSSGAAAGIMLSVASCIAGTDPANTFAFPHLDGLPKTEVIVQRSSATATTTRSPRPARPWSRSATRAEELEAAISDKTACIVWFAGGPLAQDALPGRRGDPDREASAASRSSSTPLPRSRRSRASGTSPATSAQTGAVFSGGKGIRGPQSSGLVLGTKELIAGCRANGNPNHSLGRPMKVGKEELAGILAAVEYTLDQDETALLEQYENIVHGWIEDLAGLPGVTAERRFPSEAGQPHGRAFIHFNPPCPVTRDEVVQRLWDGDPPSPSRAVHDEPDAIALNPQTVDPAEADIVANAYRRVVEIDGFGIRFSVFGHRAWQPTGHAPIPKAGQPNR